LPLGNAADASGQPAPSEKAEAQKRGRSMIVDLKFSPHPAAKAGGAHRRESRTCT
jgi:hypothetical protein